MTEKIIAPLNYNNNGSIICGWCGKRIADYPDLKGKPACDYCMEDFEDDEGMWLEEHGFLSSEDDVKEYLDRNLDSDYEGRFELGAWSG